MTVKQLVQAAKAVQKWRVLQEQGPRPHPAAAVTDLLGNDIRAAQALENETPNDQGSLRGP
jgi:hypothetical protein